MGHVTRMSDVKNSVVRSPRPNSFYTNRNVPAITLRSPEMSYLGANHSARIISVSRYELKRYKICTPHRILTVH